MAKLKIGSGIQIKAELPKLDQSSPKIGPTIVEKEAPAFDAMTIVEKVIAMLPKAEPVKEVVVQQKEVDFRPLEKKIQDLSDRMDAQAEVVTTKIDLPEVKHVTHVQDVSPEVLKQCKELIRQSEMSVMLKVSDLQKQNKKQKIVNYVLSGVLVLTIFLHLL